MQTVSKEVGSVHEGRAINNCNGAETATLGMLKAGTLLEARDFD